MNKDRNPKNVLISSLPQLFLAPVSNGKQYSHSFEGKAFQAVARVFQSSAVKTVSAATKKDPLILCAKDGLNGNHNFQNKFNIHICITHLLTRSLANV